MKWAQMDEEYQIRTAEEVHSTLFGNNRTWSYLPVLVYKNDKGEFRFFDKRVADDRGHQTILNELNGL